MATCYNRNAPEYVELSENFGGNVLRVNDIIGNWQKANNSEEFPTVVQANEFIKVSETTMNNCYDIILEGEDYTLGKMLEYLFYSDYFENQKILSFCAFQKPHPHIDVSIIRLAYKNEVEVENITANLLDCCNKGIEIYSNLLKQINSQM